MPAACSAWRCWETVALDSASTVRGAWASRSSTSRRTGLAKALPITEIAWNRTSLLSRVIGIVYYSIDSLIGCQGPTPIGGAQRVLPPAAERRERTRVLPAGERRPLRRERR